MFFIIFTQLLEQKIPHVLVRRALLGTEIETNFFELLSSFLIHFAIFEEGTLSCDPGAQFRVFLVMLWHIVCNVGRDTCGVLVVVFNTKVKHRQPKTTHSDHVFHNIHATA
jgi:hypothetical protein